MWEIGLALFALLALVLVLSGIVLSGQRNGNRLVRQTETKIGEQNLLVAKGTLTSEQLLKFVTAPPILVEGVPGKVLNFVTGFVQFFPGTVAYSEPGNDGMQLYQEIGNDDSYVAYNENATNFMDSTNIFTFSLPQFGSRAGNMAGSPFFLSFRNAGDDPTTGNGTMNYVIWYTVN